MPVVNHKRANKGQIVNLAQPIILPCVFHPDLHKQFRCGQSLMEYLNPKDSSRRGSDEANQLDKTEEALTNQRMTKAIHQNREM